MTEWVANTFSGIPSSVKNACESFLVLTESTCSPIDTGSKLFYFDVLEYLYSDCFAFYSLIFVNDSVEAVVEFF